MKTGLLLICVALVFGAHVCNGELFSALATMKRALYIEKKLAEILRSYIPLIHDAERSRKVEQMATDYDEHADRSLVDAEMYLANPVNAYMLCKRFTAELPAVKGLLWSGPLKTAFDEQLGMYASEMPTEEDLHGVIDAILRLQDTYQIPVHKFIDGTFSPANNSPVMTASDCFVIGRHAYNMKDKYHALLWLTESLTIFDEHGHQTTAEHDVDLRLLLDYLTYTVSDQGNLRHALVYAQRLLSMSKDNEGLQSRMSMTIERLHSEIAKENQILIQENRTVPSMDNLPEMLNHQDRPRMATQEFRNYEALCRGEDVMANPYESQLSCFYSTQGGNPLLILAPAKMEEKYRNPDMYVYHDVVSDREIEIIKLLATPLLARAVIFDPATGKQVKAFYRVSRSAWLRDNDHPIVGAITNRIAAMTQLDMETVEQLQVVNYGIGGQYEPHFDHARSNDGHQFEARIGNRVATWIFYFSDVPAGGYTVFTEIGVKIAPKKGTAAFWWNLKKNGDGDENTRHAGCPVLAGSKWVANKWMHIRGQEWKRPCGLSPDE